VIHCAQRALPPKAADLHICLWEQVSDGLTGFSCFAPAAGEQVPAMLSQFPRVRAPSGKPIRAGLHPVPPTTRSCDPDHMFQSEADPLASLQVESSDRGRGETSPLGRAQ